MKFVTIVICDSVPSKNNKIVFKKTMILFLVYLFLSISTIRASRKQIEMKKILTFFDTQSENDIVCNL